MHREAQPDRSTQAARELAKSFFEHEAAPKDLPKKSLDELDQVERHINQGTTLSEWLCAIVFEPERKDGGEVIWYLRPDWVGHAFSVVGLN